MITRDIAKGKSIHLKPIHEDEVLCFKAETVVGALEVTCLDGRISGPVVLSPVNSTRYVYDGIATRLGRIMEGQLVGSRALDRPAQQGEAFAL